MNANKKQIIIPISDLRADITNKSNPETQCNFGETLNIIDKKLQWYKVRCDLDNYEGWVNMKDVGPIMTASHLVAEKNIIVYKKPNIYSNVLLHLFCGAKVKVKKHNEEWNLIQISLNKVGYFSRKHNIIKKKEKCLNWVNLANQFVGTPYQLGGKSILGIDCSGLVQIILELSGIQFPRNTNDQIKFTSQKIKDTNIISKGCLIFWDGHVALSLSNKVILHSNAYTMNVTVENLNVANKRIKKKYGSFKKIKKIFFSN